MTKTILTVIGAPGAGKGTQAPLLEGRFNIPHFSTGDYLRESLKKGTDLGLQAKTYMDQGLLVPDTVMVGMISEKLADSPYGIILDGFPRNVPQAEFLDDILGSQDEEIQNAIYYHIPDEVAISRIKGRAEALIKEGMTPRKDDLDENTIRKRLEVYHKDTDPVINHYARQGKLLQIDALQSVEDIFKYTVKHLE